jgi:hypothetical protein
MAALALALDIMQVVSFSWELLTAVSEIQKAGSTAEHEDSRRTATELRKLNLKLRTSSSPSGIVSIPGDEDLNSRAADSVKAADELIALLDQCTVTGKRTLLRSFRQAVKKFWTNNKVLLQERLSIDTNKWIESLSLSEDARYR